MNRNEEKVFFNNMKIIRQFLDETNNEGALRFLLEIHAFDNREDLYNKLCSTPTYSEIINDLIHNDLNHNIFLLNDGFHKADILELMICKAMKTMSFPFKHFELIDKEYGSKVIHKLGDNVSYYLTYHYCKQCIEDLMDTCSYFSIQELNYPHFSFDEMLLNYFMYVALCKTKNEEDKAFYSKVKRAFPNEKIKLQFRKNTLKDIDLIELNAVFHEVRYDCSVRYYLKSGEFSYYYDQYDSEQFDEDEEDFIYISTADVDQRYILELYIRQADVDEEISEALYDALYQKHTFRKVKEILRSINMLNDFYAYQDRMIRLCEISWCMENDFDFMKSDEVSVFKKWRSKNL